MKKTILSMFALLVLAICSLQAQALPHSAVLTITPASDATASTGYNIYRAQGACPVTGISGLTFTKLNTTPILVTTYTDSTLTAGTWCFYATAVLNGSESVPSVTAGGTAKPNTVTFTLVIQ